MYSVIHVENDDKVEVTRTVFRNPSLDLCWDFVAIWLNSENKFTREIGFELEVVDKLGDPTKTPSHIARIRSNAMVRDFARTVSH